MSFALIILTVTCLIESSLSIVPTTLLVEYMQNPYGIDVTNPRFFWAIDSEGIRGAQQNAYQIIIYDIHNEIVVDTKKISSSQFSHVTIPQFNMISHKHYKWTVTIFDSSNKQSSETGFFSAGLLNQPFDWKNASWIGITSHQSNDMNQFRHQFMIKTSSTIRFATCYIAVPGYYSAYLNNQLIDDHALGYFTTFQMRAYYDPINCTNFLHENEENVFGITLGNGWYSQPSVDVGKPMVKILIYIQFNDNSTQEIITNNQSWYQHCGPIKMNDIYKGEFYDATQETKGWLLPNYNDSNWIKASNKTNPIIGNLSSSAIMPKAKKMETFPAITITEPAPNVFTVGFVQNVAGYCRITIPGNNMRGKNVTMIHSEEINQTGFVVMMYTKSPMIATYTLRGDGNPEIYTPTFTYFGFQYVQITGFPGTITKNDIISLFIHTAFNAFGAIQFGPTNGNINATQNTYLLNRIQSMTRYSAMSNYINIPTDCPQRERRGWLGDAQLAAQTAIYNFDMAASYTKFLRDIRDSQLFLQKKGGENGLALPDAVPYYNHGKIPGDPSWTMAYINLVYWMYKYYGDIRLINQHYEGMRQHLNYLDFQMDSKNGLLPLNVSYWGDYCAVTHGTQCKHASALINTFDYAIQCKYYSELATIIGNKNDATTFNAKYIKGKQAIYNNFWDSSEGAFVDNQPGNAIPFDTAQALSLSLGVLNDTEEIKKCVDSLVNDMINKQNSHLTVGIIGTKFVLRELCNYGHCDVALKSVLYRNYPSYGWWVENKATTLWENWQTTQYKQGSEQFSKNHIMFGSESNWYYEYLAGIKPMENSTNWNSILIDPYTNASLYNILNISATVNTLRGKIHVSWLINENGEICANANEGQNVEIYCQDEIESIQFASYGTPIGNCGNYQINAKCNNNNTMDVVKSLCVGKQSCSISVTSEQFGYDPCHDVPKYFDVEAICKKKSNYSIETRNIDIPTGAIAEIIFRTLPSATNMYQRANNWTITEGGKVVFENGKFINGDDGVVNGKTIDDETVQIVVLSGSYSFSRYA